jgi:hypothetical protein
VRTLLVAAALGLVVLFGAPAAHADDYPPSSPGIGIHTRPAPPGQPTGAAGGLPATGSNNLGSKLGVGAGLIVAGSTILVVTRRRSLRA